MKVIQVNEHDSFGGAGRAARVLHETLRSTNVDSWMYTQNRAGQDCHVLGPTGNFNRGFAMARGLIDQRHVKKYLELDGIHFSANLLPDSTAPKINALGADLVNLHWIGNGFLHIDTIAKFTAPLVWTLHDMWALTGGCQWDAGCLRYTRQCGQCPVLESKKENDLSRRTHQRKLKHWRNLNLHLVTPSRWLAEAAAQSATLRDYPVSVIPNGLDLAQFKPWPKELAREILGLPQDKLCLVFGAIAATRNQNKGFHLLAEALRKLKENPVLREKILLIVFGSSEPANPPDLGFPIRYLGHLRDNPTIALTYAAADAVIVPSKFENLPTTALEAAACGVPVVGFNTTGVAEVVVHAETGYLAKTFDSADLAEGIRLILMSRLAEINSTPAAEINFPAHSDLRRQSRLRAEQNYDRRQMAQSYLALYQRILERQTKAF